MSYTSILTFVELFPKSAVQIWHGPKSSVKIRRGPPPKPRRRLIKEAVIKQIASVPFGHGTRMGVPLDESSLGCETRMKAVIVKLGKRLSGSEVDDRFSQLCKRHRQ